MAQADQAIKILLSFLLVPVLVFSQTESAPKDAANKDSAAIEKPQFEEVDEGGGQSLKLLNGEPSKKKIKRHLSLVAGVKHDEEFLIPNVPLNFKGSVELVEMQRIKGTDMFRILPTKSGNGIITIHNKKTGQVLVEMQIDIREQSIEKNLREIKALLVDIEGLEFKIVNGRILIDGFVLLPKDLLRIANVMAQFGPEIVRSLVTLSPLARKKIADYISKEINNPEITVTTVGDYIKLEGFVNSPAEKNRISDIVGMYIPDIVQEKGSLENLSIMGRKTNVAADSLILNLIEIRTQEEKVEPPPKMIQVVVHFVEFSDKYLKNFSFTFSPNLSEISSTGRAPTTTLGETINLISNLLPKLNWARNHGYVRLLDTASVLTQDKNQGRITRNVMISSGATTVTTPGAAPAPPTTSLAGNLTVVVTPTIKQERTGLVEMQLSVATQPQGATINPSTSIDTKISVRDRQSAAFGGIINKKSSNDYGGPAGNGGAIVTFNHGKKYEKTNGNFVVFVTPIIKSSASAGVEQVKKKFRMKE